MRPKRRGSVNYSSGWVTHGRPSLARVRHYCRLEKTLFQNLHGSPDSSPKLVLSSWVTLSDLSRCERSSTSSRRNKSNSCPASLKTPTYAPRKLPSQEQSEGPRNNSRLLKRESRRFLRAGPLRTMYFRRVTHERVFRTSQAS